MEKPPAVDGSGATDDLHERASDRLDDSSSHKALESTEIPQGSAGLDRFSEVRLIRKQDVRIIPLCAVTYLLAYLDRSNIGNAKVMNEKTGDDVW
jgi:hypothetical protein